MQQPPGRKSETLSGASFGENRRPLYNQRRLAEHDLDARRRFFRDDSGEMGNIGQNPPEAGDELTRRRRDNLSDLCKRRADGDVRAFAGKLRRSPSTLYKWLDGSRRISDRIAREIERHLGLVANALDQPRSGLANAYYLMVNVQGHRIRGFIEYLRQFDAIQEASALFGEKDVFIKIEATEAQFQRMVLHQLQTYPGVRHTQTFKSLERSRWQRKQVELHLLPEDKPEPRGFLDGFIERKTEALMDGFRAIDKKEICIHKDDAVAVLPLDILSHLREEAKSTMRWSKDRFRDNKDVLAGEKNKVMENCRLLRIILLDDKARASLHRVKVTVDKCQDAGIQVKLLNEEDWRPTPGHGDPEGYTIYDSEFIVVQKRRSDLLLFSTAALQAYLNNFDNNWAQARHPGEYFELHDA